MTHQRYGRLVPVSLMALALWVSSAVSASAQDQTQSGGIVNGGFEEQNAQGRPVGWLFPPALEKIGYRFSVVTDNVQAGKSCVLVDATQIQSGGQAFGNVMQSISAVPLRGQRVRFRAAVRTGDLADDGRAQLWFRVDRAAAGGQNKIGAFDNMQNRPIRDSEWKHYEIVGQVDDDAIRIHVGMLVLGKGKAWLDDASLEVVSDKVAATAPKMGSGRAVVDDPSQPFFNWWLLVVAAALGLFVLSQTPPGITQRIAFRFSFAYWLLYNLPTPTGSIVPVWGYPLTRMYQAGVDKVVRWTAASVLGIQQPLIAPNGSGDTTFDYVRLFVCFCLALGIAALWSILDRKSTSHVWLNDLLRSYLRYVLAIVLLGYGLAKLTSTFNQFPAPEVDQLLKPYGESSPMNLVWTLMGSSRPYTFFCGFGEVLGALLLIFRRTTTLGALVSVGVMLNVVMLNFCFDVPVKQFSAHLLLMSLYLLLPEVPRLAGLLIWNRPVAPIDLRPPYAGGPRAIWVQRAAKVLLICLGIGSPLTDYALREFANRGTTATQPALFGSYEVESFTREGQIVPPLLNDSTRWRRVTLRHFSQPFGSTGQRDMLLIRMMDDNAISTMLTVSPDGRTLKQSQVPILPAEITIKPVDEGHIVLSGTVQGKPLEAKLRRLKREDFLLVRRGFHWINEYPFNR